MAAAGAAVAAMFAVAAIAAVADTAQACDGFTAKNVVIKACDGSKNAIDLKDVKPELTKRCTVTATGCLISNKSIESAWITYSVKKDGVMLNQGEQDGCQFLEENKDNENTRPFLDVLNMPLECPMSPGKICGNNKEASLHKYRGSMAGFTGKYDISFRIDYPDDTGACFDASFDLVGPGGLF